MQKFNLFNEIVVADKNALLTALSSARPFGITLEGEIIYEPFEPFEVLIFSGTAAAQKVSALMPRQSKSIGDLLGNTYTIVEDGDRVLIKAGGAWQEIIGFNNRHADYDDTSGDGIAEFMDKELEEIGWHATEFHIGYRDIVDEIEAKCKGVLLCIEQEEPSYRFSGLGFIQDHECARKVAFDYCKNRIAELVENDPDYAPDNLTDDEADAAEFFGVAN